MRTVLTTAFVAVVGSAVLWWGTDQGAAFTAEAARRVDIAAAPRLLPDVTLHDQTGAEVALSDYRGAALVAEFVYATCPDICLTLGTAFEQLDAALPNDVRLLSVSFDPRDDTERLGWFAERHRAKSPRWRIAGITQDDARTALLDRAGVVVIPDRMGGFVHNAGLYLIDAEGRLTAVFDPEDIAGLQEALLSDAR